MSLLSRLFSRNTSPEPLIDSVAFDGTTVTRRHPDGRMELLDWDELREVAVMVQVDEHGRASHRIVLTGRKTGLIFGKFMQGGDAMLPRLRQLPGFMHATFNDAMDSRRRARIVCWRPPGMPVNAPARTGMGQHAPEDREAPRRMPEAAPPPGPGSLRLDIAPKPHTVAGYAADAIRKTFDVYQVELDWSLESLGHLDRILKEWHEGGAPLEAVNKSMYSMGSYAGQVLLLEASGRWVAPTTDDKRLARFGELFLVVELEDGRRWSPIGLCVEALMDGPRVSLLRSAQGVLRGAAS